MHSSPQGQHQPTLCPLDPNTLALVFLQQRFSKGGEPSCPHLLERNRVNPSFSCMEKQWLASGVGGSQAAS